MPYQAKARKNMRGAWEAETLIVLQGTLALNIVTMKRHSGDLVTSVRGVTIEGNAVSYVMGQGFYRQFTSSPARVTAKTVEAQHNNIEFEVLIQQAKEFYKI